MKKRAATLVALLLLTCGFACAPARGSATPEATPTPMPSAALSALEQATTPEALQALIRQLQEKKDFQGVYDAARKLTQIDPANADAYLTAASALLALNEQNEQEMKRVLAEGLANAPDGVNNIKNWLTENGLEGAVELPFVPDYTSSDPINTLGNSSGNISSILRAAYWRGGFVTTQAGWIYYSRFTDDPAALYKMRTDGSGQMKFEGVHGYSLNVVGDWLYFINPDDGDKPYKMRTDGSKLQKLSDFGCSSMSVCGDWVYSDGYNGNGSYYRFRTDGSEQTQLCDYVITLNFSDGKFGYVMKKSMDDGGLIRISLDDGTQTRISSSIPFFGFCITDDAVYARDESDPWAIVKTDLSGGNAKQVFRANDQITALNLYKDKLIVAYGVYSDKDDNLVSREIAIVDLATGEIIRSWEAHTDPLCVGEGLLFYTEQDEGMRWHCVNIDTGEELKME
jgi:hypothetical protein